MSQYRRSFIAGGTYFFTIVTARRRPLLTLPETRSAMRTAIAEVRKSQPFDIDAWVVLPDHMHCIWTLPENDTAYSARIGRFKILTSKALGYSGKRDSGLWQRRFWEHQIRDERDLVRHIEYIFINPVKHGFCQQVVDWPFSSFHRYVRQGLYPRDWAGKVEFEGNFGE
ncbi:MAG: transposase [Oleibacter sp.]|nr:transposase [Thalassolituus sp.]|tara:strand:- start:62 stop:568 length:507 start_codon:yes stop_codon:yes gene_type:complete